MSATRCPFRVNAGAAQDADQHLIQWVISAGEFKLRRWVVWQSVLDTEVTPDSFPTGEEELQAAGPGRTFALQGLFAFTGCCYSFARQIAFWPGMRGTMRAGQLYARLCRANARLFVAEIRRRFSSTVFTRLASSSVRHLTAQVVPRGALSPRGDWRPRRICQREI